MKTNKDLIIEPNAAIEGRKYSEEKPWSCNYPRPFFPFISE